MRNANELCRCLFSLQILLLQAKTLPVFSSAPTGCIIAGQLGKQVMQNVVNSHKSRLLFVLCILNPLPTCSTLCTMQKGMTSVETECISISSYN